MKVVIESNSKDNKEIKYPILMQDIERPNIIVLFTSAHSGTYLGTEELITSKFGSHCNCWEAANNKSWQPLNGNITLSNE